MVSAVCDSVVDDSVLDDLVIEYSVDEVPDLSREYIDFFMLISKKMKKINNLDNKIQR